jgi:hypothetical protein
MRLSTGATARLGLHRWHLDSVDERGVHRRVALHTEFKWRSRCVTLMFTTHRRRWLDAFDCICMFFRGRFEQLVYGRHAAIGHGDDNNRNSSSGHKHWHVFAYVHQSRANRGRAMLGANREHVDYSRCQSGDRAKRQHNPYRVDYCWHAIVRHFES